MRAAPARVNQGVGDRVETQVTEMSHILREVHRDDAKEGGEKWQKIWVVCTTYGFSIITLLKSEYKEYTKPPFASSQLYKQPWNLERRSLLVRAQSPYKLHYARELIKITREESINKSISGNYPRLWQDRTLPGTTLERQSINYTACLWLKRVHETDVNQ